MRRHIPTNIDHARRKARLLHRCIVRMHCDGISSIPSGYRLTDAQADLARVLGFGDWAELKKIVSRSEEATPVDAGRFSAMAGKLSSITGSAFLATALLARLGLAADMEFVPPASTSVASAPVSVPEFARSIDLLTERLMEIESSTNEAARILDLIETAGLPAGSPYDVIGYIESLLAWARFVVRGEKTALARHFADHVSIERIGGALPERGIFVMSGYTGSGRSHAGIVLARHMRDRRRVIFSLSELCGLDDRRANQAGGVIFVDDMPKDQVAFERLCEVSRHSLVIMCVIATDHVDAHNRVWSRLISCGRTHDDASSLVAGGVHLRRDMQSSSLTPWNPNTGHLHTTFFVNGDGRIFDDIERHFRSMSAQIVFTLPRDGDGEPATDSMSAHRMICESILRTTAPQQTWRGDELDRRISARLDEINELRPWPLFRQVVAEQEVGPSVTGAR